VPLSALESMQLDDVLEHVNVPSYVIDTSGVIRWLNAAARNLVGDVRGRQFTSVVASEQTQRARELFARKVVGTAQVTDAGVVVLGPDGERVGVEISSVPLLRGDRVVGVFGQVSDLVEEPHEHLDLSLTPRQAEVLQLLERGYSTSQIAQELQLSTETVRNHIRRVLRAVGAHSRLEAVAMPTGCTRRLAGGVLGQPRLRDPLLRPGQPRFGDEVAELDAVEALELRDTHQHCGVAVEVRCGEEDPAVVREEQLLHVEVGDTEHEDVGEPLAGVGIERVGPAPPLAAEELAVHAVGGAAVFRKLFRRLGQAERQFIEVGHRRHPGNYAGGVTLSL
jgi:PAS domain S-box-containing protein